LHVLLSNYDSVKNLLLTILAVVIIVAAVGTGYLLYLSNQSNAEKETQISDLRNTSGALTVENITLNKEIKKLKNKQECVSFDINTWATEKEDWYSVPDDLIQLISQLSQTALLCREDGNYVVQINHDYTGQSQPSPTLRDSTVKYFPATGKNVHPVNDVTSYEFYLYSYTPIRLQLSGQEKTLPGNELIPIASFIWDSALSFCTGKLSLYDGVFDISCGSGENMCVQLERSRIHLLDNQVEYRGMCASDCDLASDQPHTYRCGENITPPWQD
jgi:hypothetical protein